MTKPHVFLTGVHSGLGLGFASACLEAGMVVHGTSRNAPESLKDADDFLFYPMDLAQFDQIREGVEAALSGVQSLDLVVLNAGILGKIQDLHRTPIDELKSIMDINVWANKGVMDALISLGVPVKQVLAVSSGSAVNGSAGWGGYSISKSALNLLVRVYAHENPQTHFTALAPGLVDTQMLQSFMHREDLMRYEALRRIRAAHEEGRVLSPLAAAELILDRLADLREYPTGAFVDIRNMGEGK